MHLHYLTDIPDPAKLAPYACTCDTLPLEPRSKDLPCPSCCAWAADIVSAFESRIGSDRRTANAELERLWTINEIVVGNVEWSEEIDLRHYEKFAARQPVMPERTPSMIYGHTGLVHRVAVSRWALSQAEIDWREPLVACLPLSWYIAQGRARTWVTAAEVIAAPVAAIPPKFDGSARSEGEAERHVRWNMEMLIYGLLGVSPDNQSSRFRLVSHGLKDLLLAINEGALNDIYDALCSSCEVLICRDDGDYREPVRLGHVEIEGTPALVFMIYGKHAAYSRVGVLDLAAAERWIREALGDLLRFAPPELLRSRPSPQEVHRDWIDPAEGPMDLTTLFCERSLLVPPETETARQIVLEGDLRCG